MRVLVRSSLIVGVCLALSPSAQARPGFESANGQVRCAFGLYVHTTREVMCSSQVISQLEMREDRPEYVPCLVDGENSRQLTGPGAVTLLTWGKPYVLIGCYLESKRFRVLHPGESEVDGVLSCYAPSRGEIYCRSRHSGRHFAITANRLHRSIKPAQP
jgi:hypothetical protein